MVKVEFHLRDIHLSTWVTPEEAIRLEAEYRGVEKVFRPEEFAVVNGNYRETNWNTDVHGPWVAQKIVVRWAQVIAMEFTEEGGV